MKKLRYLFLSIFAFLFLAITPILADGDVYVRDDAGVLGYGSEAQDFLNTRAESLTFDHECGIYIRVFPDKLGYSNIEDFAESIYKAENLGYGASQDGVMLILTMDDRSYDILAYGDKANRAFTDYAKSKMADDYIIPHLRNNDYYSGFNEFISQCDQMLLYEESGVPFDYNTDPEYIAEQEARKKRQEQTEKGIKTGVTFGLPTLTALLTTLGMRRKNKTTGIKQEASQYIRKNGIRIVNSRDRFLYQSETRTRLPDPSDRSSGGGGGTSVNSGGFSHSSGHF